MGTEVSITTPQSYRLANSYEESGCFADNAFSRSGAERGSCTAENNGEGSSQQARKRNYGKEFGDLVVNQK